MTARRSALGVLVLGSLLGCGGAATGTAASTSARAAAHAPSARSDGRSAQDLVRDGMALLERGRCDAAIQTAFEPARQLMEAQRTRPGTTIVYSRSIGSANVLGALIGAIDPNNPQGTSDHVVMVAGSDYPDVLFLEAYCYVELHQPAPAATLLRQALELIPNDVVYACELANLEQAEAHRADLALSLYRAGLENVERLEASGGFAPTPAMPDGPSILFMPLSGWRRRAMRGIGFSLIELNQLDEAEQMFLAVLRLDPTDERAQNELNFIAERRRQTMRNTL